MKTTRKIDSLLRVTIPVKFMEEFDWKIGNQVEITLEFGQLYVKKLNTEDISKRPFVGHCRYIDSFNRVTIPRDYVRLLGIEPGTLVLPRIEDNRIKITKV